MARVTSSSGSAQAFPDLSTKSPASQETLQFWANKDDWAPSPWLVGPHSFISCHCLLNHYNLHTLALVRSGNILALFILNALIAVLALPWPGMLSHGWILFIL